MKIILLLQLFLVSLSLLSAQEVDSIIDIRDGQVYKVVKIGQQWWMQENLNIGTRIDGIQDATDNGIIEKYCFHNKDSLCNIYGGLYQWDEMMDYNPSDNGNPGITQGVCPAGWHLPGDEEWKELEMFLGMSQSEADGTYWRGTDEGGKLKETGTTHWWLPNTGATNESGFTALPGGFHLNDDYFHDIRTIAYFWSSTEYNSNWVWIRHLDYNYSEVIRTRDGHKDLGHSVRCVRDSVIVSISNSSDLDRDYQIKIYPNPCVNQTSIKFHNQNQDMYQLIIRDLTGKVIRIIDDVYDDQVEIRRDGLPGGLYLIELRGPEIYRDKILME